MELKVQSQYDLPYIVEIDDSDYLNNPESYDCDIESIISADPAAFDYKLLVRGTFHVCLTSGFPVSDLSNFDLFNPNYFGFVSRIATAYGEMLWQMVV